ncbi:MAG TPA: hypothetical protein VLZ03_03610 [Thermodesulfobacteriota bacterium]|nr:hypothetical protein [Thermodesulfobacteriota bacterium]
MTYSILKYGRLMLPDVENLEEAEKDALRFVTPVVDSEFIEIRDSANETVTIGYYDGRRFHWKREKSQIEAWKDCQFVTKPLLWRKGG